LIVCISWTYRNTHTHTQHTTVLRLCGPTGKKMERFWHATHMLHDYHVRSSVDRCQKWELFFTKPGVKTNWQYCCNILLSQQILDAMKRVIYCSFIFQQYSALMVIAFNTIHLLQCKHPSFFFLGNGPKMAQNLTLMTTRFKEPFSSSSSSSSSSMSCE